MKPRARALTALGLFPTLVIAAMTGGFAGGEQINVTVPLVFEVDPELERKFKTALDKLSR